MATLARPNGFLNFQANGNTAQPTAATLANGYGAGQVLPAAEFNQIVHVLDSWTQYLDGNLNQQVVAGQNLLPNQVVYISPGASDGGRTSGAAYLADATTEGSPRANALGFCLSAVNSDGTATAQVATTGAIGGFSGLTTGAIYYLDPSNIGGITSTSPTSGHAVAIVGVAKDSATLVIKSLGELPTDPAFNTVTTGGNITCYGATLVSQGSFANGFISTYNGSAAGGAFRFNNNPDCGTYLKNQSPTAAVVADAVNATDVFIRSASGNSMPVTLTSTTPANTPSFISSQGFKSVKEMGGFYNAAFNTASQSPGYSIAQMAGNVGPYVWWPQFSGSIVGVNADCRAVANSTNITLAVNCGTTVTQVLAPSPLSVGIQYTATFSKGQIPFAAGTAVYLRATAGTNASGNTGACVLNLSMTVEMNA
jgi:hypothetical protein